jgi:RHS repeat-associated protein
MVYLGVTDFVARETETGSTSKTRSYASDALGKRASFSETTSGTTTRLSYIDDPLGSTELMLDANVALSPPEQRVKASYGYTAYGGENTTLTRAASSFTNPYRFTGKRWDPTAKAYDMGARHYFPAQGRWFQQDQYANALANLALSLSPLTSNRYLFTGANPINYIEIDGHVAAGTPGYIYDGGSQSCLGYVPGKCNQGIQGEDSWGETWDDIKDELTDLKLQLLITAGVAVAATLAPAVIAAAGGWAALARLAEYARLGYPWAKLALQRAFIVVTAATVKAAAKVRIDTETLHSVYECIHEAAHLIGGYGVVRSLIRCAEMFARARQGPVRKAGP